MKQKELFIIQLILMMKCCHKSLALMLYREILSQGTSVLSGSKINSLAESRHRLRWLMSSVGTDDVDGSDALNNLRRLSGDGEVAGCVKWHL